jgi:hypothetical protein
VGASSNPGRGGVGRGRADAELTWGEETAGRTDQFEPEQLPDASVLDNESTAIIGVGATQPDVEPSAQVGGAVDVGASTGRSAWKRRLAPHHRDAVQGFFGGSTDKERR